MSHPLAEDLKDRFDVIFSTDVVGLTGNPRHVFEFWSKVCGGELQFGIEAIALVHAMPKLTPSYLGHHFRHLAGLHSLIGQPIPNHRGLVETAKVGVLQKCIVPPEHVARSYQKIGAYYVNVHDLHFLQLHGQFPGLAVENDQEVGSADRLIGLHTLGILKIFDWKHYSLETASATGKSFDWQIHWPEVIAKRRQICPDLDHISRGTDWSDSLPEVLPDGLLVEAAAQVQLPVIEFQLGAAKGSLGNNPAVNKSLIAFARDRVKSLFTARVIKPRVRPFFSLA